MHMGRQVKGGLGASQWLCNPTFPKKHLWEFLYPCNNLRPHLLPRAAMSQCRHEKSVADNCNLTSSLYSSPLAVVFLPGPFPWIISTRSCPSGPQHTTYHLPKKDKKADRPSAFSQISDMFPYVLIYDSRNPFTSPNYIQTPYRPLGQCYDPLGVYVFFCLPFFHHPRSYSYHLCGDILTTLF